MSIAGMLEDREAVLKNYLKDAAILYKKAIKEDTKESKKHAKEILCKMLHSLEMIGGMCIYENDKEVAFTLEGFIANYWTFHIKLELEDIQYIEKWIIDDMKELWDVGYVYEKLYIEDHMIDYVKLNDTGLIIFVNKINDLFLKTTYHYTDFDNSCPGNQYWESFRAGRQLIETLKYICKFRGKSHLKALFKDNMIICKLIEVICQRYIISDAIIAELFWFNQLLYGIPYNRRDVIDEVSNNISSCLNRTGDSIRPLIKNTKYGVREYVDMLKGLIEDIEKMSIFTSDETIDVFLNKLKNSIKKYGKGYAYASVSYLINGKYSILDSLHALFDELPNDLNEFDLEEFNLEIIIKEIHEYDLASNLIDKINRVNELQDIKDFKIEELKMFLVNMESSYALSRSSISDYLLVDTVKMRSLHKITYNDLIDFQDELEGEVLEYVREVISEFDNQHEFTDVVAFIKQKEINKTLEIRRKYLERQDQKENY